jgi:glycosyltransferase involved in cell wall biosynthesis
VEQASEGRVEVIFHGWLAGEALDAAWRRSELLVVPSTWPEPFGLVGPEAGVHGVPAAAFGVGGITEWLTDGENGHVADGSGALRAPSLADAIARCLADPAHWRRLSDGARRLAGRFRLAPHVAALEATFAAAISMARSSGAA